MKLNNIIPIASIVGLTALILMLNFTSPTEIGPFGVLLFFTTLYITTFGVMTFVIKAFYRLAFKKTNFKSKDYLFSAVLSFGPIMLLMARSFRAINLWTVSLIVIFLFLAEFLVVKRT